MKYHKINLTLMTIQYITSKHQHFLDGLCHGSFTLIKMHNTALKLTCTVYYTPNNPRR